MVWLTINRFNKPLITWCKADSIGCDWGRGTDATSKVIPSFGQDDDIPDDIEEGDVADVEDIDVGMSLLDFIDLVGVEGFPTCRKKNTFNNSPYI